MDFKMAFVGKETCGTQRDSQQKQIQPHHLHQFDLKSPKQILSKHWTHSNKNQNNSVKQSPSHTQTDTLGNHKSNKSVLYNSIKFLLHKIKRKHSKNNFQDLGFPWKATCRQNTSKIVLGGPTCLQTDPWSS